MVSSNVILEKNDGTESFTLPADTVKQTGKRSPFVSAGKGTVKDFVGSIPELQNRTYEISGQIQNIDASDYPNDGDYNDDNAGFAEELNLVLDRWDPTVSDEWDLLKWDDGIYTGGGRGTGNPRKISGTVTNVQIIQDNTSDAPRTYSFTIEFTQVDVYTDA